MIQRGKITGHYIISEGTTEIAANAFIGYPDIVSIEIPNSITKIGQGAFYNCRRLAHIKIPDSVTFIGNFAFTNCTSLTNIEIPSSVKSIGQCVFKGCTALASVEIPNSVTCIGREAFRNCTSLMGIEIPNSVTSIDFMAFAGCIAITSIEIPNSVVSLGKGVFAECQHLVHIELPNSITQIGRGAFKGCVALTDVEIPNSVTTIEIGTFWNCTKLSNIIIPNSIVVIEPVAFSGTSIVEIKMPYLVKTVHRKVFAECKSLTKVYLSRQITEIGSEAFEGCDVLSEFHILAEDPTQIKATFNEEDVKNVSLYVPKGTGYAYRHHSEFSKFREVKTECSIGSPLHISSKNVFAPTFFHNNESWKLVPFEKYEDVPLSWAASKNKYSFTPYLLVQRIVDGKTSDVADCLFLSTLYLPDEAANGVKIPRDGKFNKLVRKIWDDPGNTTDAICIRLIIDTLYSFNPEGIIICHRDIIVDYDGVVLKKRAKNGEEYILNTINWDY